MKHVVRLIGGLLLGASLVSSVPMAGAAQQRSLNIGYSVPGLGFPFFAIMLDGAAGQVSEGGGAADTTIRVGWDDWQQMAAGQLDGMTAFMMGKLKVEGDMSNAMQLQGVLAKLRS